MVDSMVVKVLCKNLWSRRGNIRGKVTEIANDIINYDLHIQSFFPFYMLAQDPFQNTTSFKTLTDI